jgi:hypothetical protein
MANKVRLTVSLDAEVVSKFKSLSHATGKPVSTFFNEVLSASLPHIDLMTQAVSMISTDPARALKLLDQATDDAGRDFHKKVNEIKDKRKLKATKKVG